MQQRVPDRLGQLSQGKGDGAALSYVRQCAQDSSAFSGKERLEAFSEFANYYYNDGIQWHLDYLDECTHRAEEVKQRFIEKKFHQRHKSPSKDSSVFRVQEAKSEVSKNCFSRERIHLSSIMDNYPAKLCQEKSEKLQNLIDHLYQLELDTAELENEALPKIILTDCSSSPARDRADTTGDETKSVQNNNAKSIARDDSLKHSVDSSSDNQLNNNNGCFLQPHFKSLKVDNCLTIPTTGFYQSEARPP